MADRSERGRKGASKALANPFRLNGWSPNWFVRRIGASQIAPNNMSTTEFVRGIYGGMLAEAVGYGSPRITERMAAHFEDTLKHTPVVRETIEAASA